MSDAQKIIRDVIVEAINKAQDDAYLYGAWNSRPEIDPDALAAEVDRALGGLKREALDKPEFRETGEMIPNHAIGGPVMVPERRLHFIPSFRWVSGWSEENP